VFIGGVKELKTKELISLQQIIIYFREQFLVVFGSKERTCYIIDFVNTFVRRTFVNFHRKITLKNMTKRCILSDKY